MLYGSFLHENIQNQVCKRAEMNQGQRRAVEVGIISPAEWKDDGGQEQQGVVQHHQNQDCHDALFFPGVDGEGGRQGSERPHQGEDEHREWEEEEDGEQENWIHEVRREADEQVCD